MNQRFEAITERYDALPAPRMAGIPAPIQDLVRSSFERFGVKFHLSLPECVKDERPFVRFENFNRYAGEKGNGSLVLKLLSAMCDHFQLDIVLGCHRRMQPYYERHGFVDLHPEDDSPDARLLHGTFMLRRWKE